MAEENVNTNTGAAGSEQTFTQAEVDNIVAKRLARATRGMPSEDELKAYNAWKANQQSEAEKLKDIEKERDTEKTARLAAEAAQAEEAEAVPESAFEWWMIPVALGTFALGGGIVLLSLHSAARRRKKYTGKFVRK